jgi:tyrosyl-tRNA synthetase
MRVSDSAFDLLVERGFVHQSSNDDRLREVTRQPITLYCGYDATATSLTAGHLVPIMILAHMQRAGHNIIGIVGGGTTMIGDPRPSGDSRPLLSREQIATNMRGIETQLANYVNFNGGDFDGGRARMLDNAEWLLELKYIDFLREIGRHFSVNQLLQHETYRNRLNTSGLSMIELNYAIMQAYDFLHLYREYGCILQVGGSDQWFNILTGVELIRRAAGGEAFALVAPLITTASGAKMGKTESGAVWLDPERTSPYEFYQYWINTEDLDVGRYFKMFTFVALDEIRRMEALQGAELRSAKELLAFEITRQAHGDAAAEQARASARALFGGGDGDLSSVPTTRLDATRVGVGIEVVELFALTGLSKSKGEAKRLIQQGGAYVGDSRVDDPDARLDATALADGVLLRAGRKRFHRVIAGS